MVSLTTIRARQPRELLRTDVHRTIPPEDLTPADLAALASNEVLIDPARVLRVYKQHVANGSPDPAVLIRAFTQLGFLFDPNSFFSTADRQLLTAHRDFRCLAHDLAQARGEVPDAAAPVLLYALACLEYRCPPLLPTLLDAIERHLPLWRSEVLSLALHSAAKLGLGGGDGQPVEFDLEDGARSRDYGGLCRELTAELGRRALGGSAEEMSLHDWSRAAFGAAMAGLYDTPVAPGGEPALPALVAAACARVQRNEELDASGWAQFFLYQTLYCADVEKPACEELLKRAVPMWAQERLHYRWLNDIVLRAQPQGADQMQRDVDLALRRTNTQALLNCSAGREWDEQHCWFAGFMLEPRIALECDSMLPLGPGRPLPSGWISMKSRVLRKMGFGVVTLHRCRWDPLTEDQKDEQMLRMRLQLGYQHDKELEKRNKKIRQTPHTYKGIESKRKEWSPLPPDPA